jgi:hypothetical protein
VISCLMCVTCIKCKQVHIRRVFVSKMCKSSSTGICNFKIFSQVTPPDPVEREKGEERQGRDVRGEGKRVGRKEQGE